MKITRIDLQKKRQDHYNVFVDEQFFCALNGTMLARLRFKEGETLSPKRVEELKEAADFGKARDKALRLLGMRAHSRLEIVRKLQGIPPEVINKVLTELDEKGYLDDRAFAKAYAESVTRAGAVSARRLKNELKKRGVALALIEEAVASFAPPEKEEEGALSAGRKKLRGLKTVKDAQKKKKRLYDFLVRQGFDFSAVQKAVRQLVKGESEDEGE